ncbi:MazG-like family protein [Actinoplanes sp. DH11]|uniref:MazG-like family protein n=1 Tax=Actinoplanes sp. DH11 TaxID=2857011 RepID=UPI001E371F07|nr:MazG-like family protein [Actinoplanes sp. DH11]
MKEPTVWSEAKRWRTFLDERNGTSDLEMTLRILKLTEESGEAAQAWIGRLGQNPRKGVTHTHEQVVGELADVVFTALVALESIGADAHEAVRACAAKASGYLPPA